MIRNSIRYIAASFPGMAPARRADGGIDDPTRTSGGISGGKDAG